MKLDALDHPKTFDFAARLEVGRATSIGHLELFWHFVAKHAPQGNIGKFSDGAIARACDWQGDAETFVKALLKSGLLDESKAHRYLVHDWPEHCPNWVRAQLGKLKQGFFTPDDGPEVATEAGSYEQSSERSTRARVSKPSHTKGSQGIRKTHAREADEPEPQPAQEWIFDPANPSASARGGSTGSTLPDDLALMNAWAVVMTTYPNRTGRTAWGVAEHHWRRQLEQGATVAQLHAGVERYAAYVAGGGVSGPQFVLAPDKFFGDVDRPWSMPWALPPRGKNGDEDRVAGNLAAAQEFLAGGSA